MAENIVIPPVPDDRPGQYKWIDNMVALGWKIGAACKMAGVPAISYYKVHRKGQKAQEPESKEGAA